MSREIENQLKRCFRLLANIKEEYPEDDFDREMLQGDMDFRYRQIKEDREELEAFPPVVREFARFKDTLSISDKTVKTFFRAVMKEPEPFATLQTIEFQKRQEKIEVWAAELGTGLQILINCSRVLGCREFWAPTTRSMSATRK